MTHSLAQLLMLFSSAALEAETRETAAESPYRPRCGECDELGRDARLPCEGHD